MKNIFYPAAVSNRVSIGLLVLRLAFGTAFIFHGYGKIIHPFNWMGDTFPGFLQFLGAFAEFGGGIALVVGFLTPLAALGLICTMAVALFMVHIPAGHAFVASGPGQPSYEPALVYLAISIMFFMTGAGTYSLDSLVFGHNACKAHLDTAEA